MNCLLYPVPGRGGHQGKSTTLTMRARSSSGSCSPLGGLGGLINSYLKLAASVEQRAVMCPPSVRPPWQSDGDTSRNFWPRGKPQSTSLLSKGDPLLTVRPSSTCWVCMGALLLGPRSRWFCPCKIAQQSV